MVEIVEESTIAPGPYGKDMEIKPYEEWPLPYRGSKYSLVEKEIDGESRWFVIWKYRDLEPIYNKDKNGNPNLPGNLISCFRRIGKNGGRFRVTPKREVLTKVKNNNGNWISYYLGKLEGEWNFGHNIDLNPYIEPFSIWTGFPFNHGECWSVWIRRGAGSKLYWKSETIYLNSIKEHPNLVKTYLELRPLGGRLYINEYGHIWMNLKKDDLGIKYKYKIKYMIEKFFETFKGNKRLIQMRLRHSKGCWPIYLGNIETYDYGDPPRLYFENISSIP